MEIVRVWEWVSTNDTLVEHICPSNDLRYTLCHKQTWSPETDPSVDPEGTVSEDVWFADHDRPDAVVPCAICHPSYNLDKHPTSVHLRT
jgi:hypothetical protein